MKKLIFISFAIFALLNGFGCEAQDDAPEIKSTSQTALGNMYNGGLISEGQGGVYFVMPKISTDGVFWVSYDDMSKAEKISQYTKTCLVVADSKIYYVDEIDGGCLYSADLRFETPKKLTDEKCGEVLEHGDFIVYTTENALKMLSLEDGEDILLLNEHVSNICVKDGYVYFVITGANGGIFRICIEDAEQSRRKEIILQDDIARFFIVGDEIYYLAGNVTTAKIYSYNMLSEDISDITALSPSMVYVVLEGTFHIFDDELIYGAVTIWGEQVLSYNIKTEKTRQLMEYAPDYLFVANGGIIFQNDEKWMHISIENPNKQEYIGLSS